MMFKSHKLYIIFFISGIIFLNSSSGQTAGKDIDDYIYKFTFKLPDGWASIDMKETTDKDAISYSFMRDDKKMTIMLLAFKLSSVKNIDDFIYNLEKDISLNIPAKSGEYTETDFGKYDMKSAAYKDNKFDEMIYYYRTKLPESPNNFVYMVRFISEVKDYNSDSETQIKDIISTFKPTAE